MYTRYGTPKVLLPLENAKISCFYGKTRSNIVTKIGNVFCGQISPHEKRNISNTLPMICYRLNSSVIRVFERTYPTDQEPKLTDVVQGRLNSMRIRY